MYKRQILENDFGAINVDMMVLEEELGDQCELEMVVGGGDLDCHRRRFKTKLISMGMRGFDRILVEPSGIYDVDEFFDVLHEEPLDKWYEIGNVIALVNSKLENNLSKQSDYLLGCQVADAGKIILSRSSEATEEEINNTITHLNNTMSLIKCKRRFNKEDFPAFGFPTITVRIPSRIIFPFSEVSISAAISLIN